MSTRREREPSIPDRLPGEQELSRLYQQTPDERPPAALDAAILAEARRATRPRLRLLQGGKSLSQLSRRWAIPLSLAAALLVTIGVVRYLQDEQHGIGELGQPQLQAPRARFSQQWDETVLRAEQKNLSKLVLPKDAAQLEEDMAQSENEAMRPTLKEHAEHAVELAEPSQSVQSEPSGAAAEYRQQNVPPTSPAPVTEPVTQTGKKRLKAKRELNSELQLRRKSQDKELFAEKAEDPRMLEMTTEAAEPTLMDALEAQPGDTDTGQRIGRADTKHKVDRSPKDWLADISRLFQVGKRQEAEDSLEAFQKRYPDYTDFPDSFPEDILARLRRR